MNQDLLRYELHRVWVVEATLKRGQRHVYCKRVFYIDEDSWALAHGDIFDGRKRIVAGTGNACHAVLAMRRAYWPGLWCHL